MSDTILLARVEPTDDGASRVLAPSVGWWSAHPHGGALLGPGSPLGELVVLRHRFDLRLPDGAAGIVSSDLPRQRTVALEYGEELFRMAPVGGAVNVADVDQDAAALGHPPGADLPPGCWAIVSPTDGVFFRRPSPDAPAFAEPGTRLRPGHTVGLVEVMKTFNPIAYGGPGLPEEAEVVELRADDSDEVRCGQILLVVRRAGSGPSTS